MKKWLANRFKRCGAPRDDQSLEESTEYGVRVQPRMSMSSGKHEDSVCMMVRGFAACAASVFTSFFWHFVFCFVVFFGLHLQHNCCMQGVWKRQQDTENTRTGRQTRPFNGSPSARIACVCVRMCVNAAQWQSVNLLGATIYGISCCGASR